MVTVLSVFLIPLIKFLWPLVMIDKLDFIGLYRAEYIIFCSWLQFLSESTSLLGQIEQQVQAVHRLVISRYL